jgi:hypothetical protein
LDELTRTLNKDGLPIKRSQIRRILRAEHVKWQKPRNWLESDDPEFGEKRGYRRPLHRSARGQHGREPGRVGFRCRQELPGSPLSEDAHRPHFRPSYERHGYLWVYRALAHREGRALIQTADARNTESWLDFLDSLEAFVPEGEVHLIVDALPLHWTVDTMLWNRGHSRFHFVPVPKAAAWLNLIEEFWKILTQRSLHGRNCRSSAEASTALHAGVDDWNRCPTPFLWGRDPRPKRYLKRT